MLGSALGTLGWLATTMPWRVRSSVWLLCGYSALQRWYRVATVWLPCVYDEVTAKLQRSYSVVTAWLQRGYSVVTVWLQRGYSVGNNACNCSY